MDDDEGPFGPAPEPTPLPIPWESGPGGAIRRFFATQVALLAPSTLVKAFGEGTLLAAIRYAAITAFLAGALRIPEWTHTLHFDSVIRVIAEGKPFLTLTPGASTTAIVLDVFRAWGLGIAVHALCVGALAASFVSLGLSFEGGARGDEAAARRRDSLLRAAFYLTTSLLLVLVLRLTVVLVVGIRERWIVELLMIPAILVMLRGLRATAIEQCKVSGSAALAVTVVPVILLLAAQMVLVDRLLAPILPPVASAEEIEDAQHALDALPRRRRDAGAALPTTGDGGAREAGSLFGAPRDAASRGADAGTIEAELPDASPQIEDASSVDLGTAVSPE